MKAFQDFTNLYSLSKTLRFELKPIGKTLEHIEQKEILKKDQELYISYQKMKKIIDNYHKDFIELALKDAELEELETFKLLYFADPEVKKSNNFSKEIEKVQTVLRKSICSNFKKNKEVENIYKKLFNKDLFKDLLKDYLKDESDLKEVEKFEEFTTYFTGFHENRRNIYSDKEQSTAIGYRLVHENLPKFLDNLETFDKVSHQEELFIKINAAINQISEVSNLKNISPSLFTLSGFNYVLTQKGIDFYNLLIGGFTEEGGKKIQGINELINLHNQTKEKNERLPKMKPLYKQILSDRNSISFLPDKFENGKEVVDSINDFYLENLINYDVYEDNRSKSIFEEIKVLLSQLPNFDTSKIYIRNGKAISDISNSLFGNWSVITNALEKTFTDNYEGKRLSKLESDKDKYLKKPYFSISEIDNAIYNCLDHFDIIRSKVSATFSVCSYFNGFFDSQKPIAVQIAEKYSCIKGLLNVDYAHDNPLHQDKKAINDIKLFLDAILEAYHFIKPLNLETDSTLEKDNEFYSNLEPLITELAKIIPLYNKVRNFATQKPYSTEKVKLNFDNSTLLDGWDRSRETANLGVLLRKGGYYYLAIMDKKKNKLFEKGTEPKSDEIYQKINYKLLPGPNKMLPKVFFSKKHIDYFSPSEEILTIRNHSSFTKGGQPQSGFVKKEFNIQDCWKMIDFYKDSILKHKEWSRFNFEFSPTEKYDSIDGFYRDVEHQGYKITYSSIDADYVDKHVNEGNLFLFKIYSKDFSPKSKGRPNLHTLYWKALFTEQNLTDVVYKLNGQAEIFYRKRSINVNKTVIHNAGEKIQNKNPNSKNEYGLFEYDIVKDKRYTVDKFLFHVPLTLNFKAQQTDNLNFKVLNEIRKSQEVNIIGIDRGERHLLYLSVIDQEGTILHQESLNSIHNSGTKSDTNYHNLLDKREKVRAESRVSWNVIENIKELKHGYISQAIHKVISLMLKYNAIVVLEDLNTGFKRGRFKVEKQVYQKFEKMLIDKLNYLVIKDYPELNAGGLQKALQLTDDFKTFKSLGRQSGFLFYVPAWNTSKIDPTTGFVNLLDTRYKNISQSKKFFSTFRSIQYNKESNYFEFKINYNDFNSRAKDSKTDWVICSFGHRIKTFRNPESNNQWDSKQIDLTLELEDLLGSVNIDYGSGNCIKDQIASVDDKGFYVKMHELLKLTLQMRNSVSGTDIDYLVSPVKNKIGEFFDSRVSEDMLPKDADANGAFHIAKKGLMWMKQIQNFGGDDWKKLKLDNTNKGWLNFVQKQ